MIFPTALHSKWFPFSCEITSNYDYEHFIQAPSTSKSNTINLVSSVPFRDPTAQISLVSFDLQAKESENVYHQIRFERHFNVLF